MQIKHKQQNHSSGNNLVTPMRIVKLCESIYGIKANIDACCTRRTRRKDRYVTKKRDFFKFKFKRSDVLFINPPHQFTGAFLTYASKLWREVGCGILILVPINTMGNPYFKKHILPHIKLNKKMFIGRIRFRNPRTMKDSKWGSVNSYVTCYLRKK